MDVKEDDTPGEFGMFQIAGGSEIVKSGRPSLKYRKKPPPGQKPEPGKPLKGGIITEAPNKNLELEFIYGYRGYDTRRNAFLNSQGDVVYHVAAAGIVLNKKKHSQTFFLEHNDDIISLVMHPDKKIVATGQVGKDPQILVWDSTNCKKLSMLKGFHERGVCSLDFSPDGNQLVSVGLDDKHSIAIWNWKRDQSLHLVWVLEQKIMLVQFNPFASDSTLVTCGDKHICFWKLAGNSLVSKKGVFGGKGRNQSMMSATFDKCFTYILVQIAVISSSGAKTLSCKLNPGSQRTCFGHVCHQRWFCNWWKRWSCEDLEQWILERDQIH